MKMIKLLFHSKSMLLCGLGALSFAGELTAAELAIRRSDTTAPTTEPTSMLNSAGQSVYQKIADGVTNEFSEESFKKAVEKSGQRDWLDTFIPYFQRSIVETPENLSRPLDEHENPKNSIQWAAFLLDVAVAADIKKNYNNASKIVHPDKVNVFAEKLIDAAPTITAKTKEAIRANVSNFGTEIFKLYGEAKTILDAAQNKIEYTEILKNAMLPEQREEYRKRAEIPLVSRLLRDLLSPLNTEELPEKTFEIISLPTITNHLKELFTEPSEKAAIQRFFDDTINGNRLDLLTSVLPEIQKRIQYYNKSLSPDKKTSLLIESFKKSDITTIYDIIAYNAYLKKGDTPTKTLPPEIETLGSLIDNLYTELLMEFSLSIAFSNSEIPNTISDFLSSHSIYWWASLHPLGERTKEGIIWGILIKNPGRLRFKFQENWFESARAIRIAQELLKKLPLFAQKHPELAEKINQSIAALQKEIALGNKEKNVASAGHPFKSLYDTKSWITNILNNPYYYGPIAWEIDNNETYKKAALEKISDVGAYYRERNEYDQFIELIENLPLNPETKAAIFDGQLMLQLTQLGSSFDRLQTALKM